MLGDRYLKMDNPLNEEFLLIEATLLFNNFPFILLGSRCVYPLCCWHCQFEEISMTVFFLVMICLEYVARRSCHLTRSNYN